MVILPKRENCLSFKSEVARSMRSGIGGYNFSTKKTMPDSLMPRPDAAVGRNRDRFEFELDTENCPSSGNNNSDKGVG